MILQAAQNPELERRQSHRVAVDPELAASLVRSQALLDAEFRGDETGEPAIHRFRPEVEGHAREGAGPDRDDAVTLTDDG
jgi:hypothetical protein